MITSDSDELEGRFSSGRANLNTSCLCYAGLGYGAILLRELGDEAQAECWMAEREALAAAIEHYFGHSLHGYETYAYHEGCEVLRSWICMPLCMGLLSRAEGTCDALMSDYLLRHDGMRTSEENETVWDRSTLYALRGLFLAGRADDGWRLLKRYSANRLLGARVPYPVEAYPEGGRRHLSGESALYCKVLIEGMLGIEPTGLHSFRICPSLPQGMPYLSVRNIVAHGGCFHVRADQSGTVVTDLDGTILGIAGAGKAVEITL